MSRVDQIAKNVKFAVICQMILVLANFIVRRVFVLTLGQEYLGLNGLFTDILEMLSLAELGFGTSMVFALYKPLADSDYEKIKSLMWVFRRVYQCVGFFVLIIGISLTPFLRFFVKEMPAGIPEKHIRWIYIVNVVNSGASYFFIYKASLLFANQKKYVEMVITSFTKIAASCLQIGALLFTGNYFYYLGIMLVSTFGQNFMVSLQVDRMYPFLKGKNIQRLDDASKKLLQKNVTANIFHKIGSVAVFGTDNILMAKLVSVSIVGIYSNYVLIRKALVNVIGLLFVSLSASMGNLNASETDEKKYEAYCHIYFFSAWLFGWMSLCLLLLYNPFITLWLGEEYLLPNPVVFLIVFNFYMYCMRMPVNNTKEAMGLFWNDRYKPILEVVVNLGTSILLGKFMGIAGVLIGTLISTVTIPFLVEPYVLYKYGLKKKISNYYFSYFLYLAVTALAVLIVAFIHSRIPSGIQGFLMKMMVCAIIPNLIYLLVYGRTKEFRYFIEVIKRLISKYLPCQRNSKS